MIDQKDVEYLIKICARSSVEKNIGLLIRGSQVRILPGMPNLKFYFIGNKMSTNLKNFLIGVIIGSLISFATVANAQQWNNGQGSMSRPSSNWNNGNVNRPPNWNNGNVNRPPNWNNGGNWHRPPNWNNGGNWNGNRTNWNVNINAGWWGVGVNNWGAGWAGGWGTNCCWGPTWVAPPIVYMQSAPVVYVQPSINQRLMEIEVLLRQGQITLEQAAVARINILNGQ